MQLSRRTFVGAVVASGLSYPGLARGAQALVDPPAIIDPHIHLWDLPGNRDPLAVRRFLVPELMEAIGTVPEMAGVIYVEASSMYRAAGPLELRSLGETEFAAGQAAMAASGTYGRPDALRAIVAKVDLTLGSRAGDILDQHACAAGGRLKGVRQSFAYVDFPVSGRPSNPMYRGLLARPDFRAGFAQLAPRSLAFDGWGYHVQLNEFRDLASAFPEVTMVLDHCGAPLLSMPGGASRNELFDDWRRAMRQLAPLPNVFVKIGGLGQVVPWAKTVERAMQTTAMDLVPVWRPFVETCIELFGPARCMFESNYPSDASTCSYKVVWDVFKTISQAASLDEESALFSGTASRVYGLQD